MPTLDLLQVSIISAALIGISWLVQSFRYRHGFRDGYIAALRMYDLELRILEKLDELDEEVQRAQR